MDSLSLITIIFSIFLLILIIVPTISLFTYGIPVIRLGMTLDVMNALVITFTTACIATFLVVLFATPLAYMLARRDFRLKSLLESLLELPMVIPHTVAGIAILLAFSISPLSQLFSLFGIEIIDSFWGIITAMAYVSSPIYVGIVRSGFESIDRNVEHIAMTLGASPLKTFLTISIPLALKHIVTGALLTWARAVSEIGAILIVAYFPKTIQVLILEKFLTEGLWSALAPSTLLLITTLLVFTLCKLLARWIECHL